MASVSFVAFLKVHTLFQLSHGKKSRYIRGEAICAASAGLGFIGFRGEGPISTAKDKQSEINTCTVMELP